jgi:hypothetical protein
MIHSREDDFMQDEPLGMTPFTEGENLDPDSGAFRAAPKATTITGDKWQQTKEKATAARERTEFFVRENPVPTIIGALAVGMAVGWALRYATAADEKESEIENPLGNLNWSFLSLPFLWPFLKTVKEKYEDSAETVKDGVDRLRKLDVDRYSKPLRKRWKSWMN